VLASSYYIGLRTDRWSRKVVAVIHSSLVVVPDQELLVVTPSIHSFDQQSCWGSMY
jgi:hypothetical protein